MDDDETVECRRGSSGAGPWVWALLGVLGAASAAGCSTEEPLPPRDGEQDATEQNRRVGSLLAEFERTADADTRRVEVHAQFLDVQGVGVGRARRALEVWSANRELDPDTCTLRSAESPTSDADREMRLDLLSVGPIEVRGPDRRLALEARRLPHVDDSFSGVIYGTKQSFRSRDSEPLRYEPGGRYTFHAEGDGATGGFRASLVAPQPVRIRPLSGEARPGESAVELAEGRDFRFRWNQSDSSEGDVFFDISTGHAPDQPHLKCRLEDDGAFSVPADLVSQLAETSDSLRVSLRRVRSSNVEIPGLQRSRFTVSAVDHLGVRVR